MKNTCIALFVLLFAVSGCKKKSEYSSFFMEPRKTDIKISVDNIVLDTLHADAPESSYAGFSGLQGDKIFFADRYSCWVYEFNKNLQPVARHMGKGRGPHELPLGNIEGYAVFDNGNHCFVGSTRDLYLYDSLFNQTASVSFLAARGEDNGENVFEREDFYNLNYENLIIKKFNESLFFNVDGGDNNYNISTPDFYHNARIMMKINGESGKIDGFMGRISPAVKFMSAFGNYQYDMDPEGRFFVSFEVDSLIYVYDNNFAIEHAFGAAGKEMKMDYAELSADDNYSSQRDAEMQTKGYFTSIKKAGDYIFRTYKTGDAAHDRMQIYRGMTLIGDVAVPHDFHVLGYIAPYFYSSIIADENAETLTAFRFKMD